MGPPQILWGPLGPSGTLFGPSGTPKNLWRTHLDPKSKKKCILFSSIFNVDRPFQRYLLKTSGPGENNPITKRKNNFFSKFPRCKISTSTFSEIGNKKKINGFGVWSGPFFLTWVHLKGSVYCLIPMEAALLVQRANGPSAPSPGTMPNTDGSESGVA